MGFYDEIEKEEAAGARGEFNRAGNYLILVNRLRSGTSEKDGSDFAAIDATILQVLPGGAMPMMINPATNNTKDWVEDPRGQNIVGEDISILYLRKYQSARRNFKAFLANAVGIPPASLTGDQCKQIEEGQLLSGEVLELTNVTIEKKDGGPFTKVWCKRRVDAAEYSEVLDPAVVSRYFPEGIDLEEDDVPL